MKKIVMIISVLFLVFTLSQTVVNADVLLTISSDTSRTVSGVTHREIIGEFNKDGAVTSQAINYMGGNPSGNYNLHVITGDDYNDLYYSRSKVRDMAANINDRFDNYHVVGGVNGDFYGNGGIPIEVYIKNGEVVSPGLGHNREVIGFKANGETVFGSPCFEGFELIIYTDTGKERIRLDVDDINQLPTHPMDIGVLFDDYETDIELGSTKLVIDASDIKRDENHTKYFGKGIVSSINEDVYEATWGQFAIVSENPYVKELAQTDDTVVVQRKAACGFEDVQWAIGAYGALVVDGVSLEVIPSGAGVNDRHPRTAVGVKSDGTVFFVTVDGRQEADDMDGMTLYELSELMAYFGAVDAYNLDGGGSTTMIIESGSNYEVLNTPSDGIERMVSNGVFFVTGVNKPTPTKLSIPDLSISLDKPKDVYIDNSNILHWSSGIGFTSFEVSIDGVVHSSSETFYALETLESGPHEIEIKALGDGFYYSASRNSRTFDYYVYTAEETLIIDYFKSFILSEIN